MQHLRLFIRLTWHTGRNFMFYRLTAVRNILQHYFGSGEDNEKPGSIGGRKCEYLEAQGQEKLSL
jgi:hypothetical protein